MSSMPTRDEEWFRQWKFVPVVRKGGDLVGECVPDLLLEDLLGDGGDTRPEQKRGDG